MNGKTFKTFAAIRSNWKRFAVVAALGITTAGVGIGSVVANAQGGPGGNGAGIGGGVDRVLGICSTTNYADVAATALGLTGAELRAALVGGKTVAQLATEKNINLTIIAAAIRTARQADITAARDAGLLTTEQYDRLVAALDAVATRQDRSGNFSMVLEVPRSNVANVKVAVEAAEALNMSCTDLVKELTTGGKTLTAIVTEKSSTLQAVIDQIVAAYKTALDQDVQEGLITQLEANGRLARLTEQTTLQVNRGAAFFGRGGGMGPRGNDGVIPVPPAGRPGRGGKDGKTVPGTDATPDAPNADATPMVTPEATVAS